MSAKYPDCPLSDHRNCRDCDNPKVCAIVREDRRCFKSRPAASQGGRPMKRKSLKLFKKEKAVQLVNRPE